jgi:hypothetical protein
MKRLIFLLMFCLPLFAQTGTGGGSGGTGTVTSVSFPTTPSWLSASVATANTTPAISLTAASGLTANQILATPNGSTGAVSPRSLTLPDLPSFFPLTMFYCDVNRTDSYTPDGSIDKPYKTFGAAQVEIAALVAAGGTGPYGIWMNPGAYTESGAVSQAAVPVVIYGNSSTLTATGGVTVNGPTVVYDLNTVGAVTYAYTGTTRSERHGGSYSGGNVIVSGFVHWYGVQASGTGGYTVTVNGTLAGDFTTGGMQFRSGGSSALIALNNSNLQKASGYNFDMTNGGMLALNGGYLTTVGSPNIYLPTANTVGTSHAIQGLIFVSGSGVSCNGATVYAAWDNLSSAPTTASCPAFYAFYSPKSVIAQAWASLTAQSSSISAMTIFTAPVTGFYRINGAIKTTTAGSAGTVTVTVSGGAASQTIDLTSLGSAASSMGDIYLAAAGTATLATTVTSNTGNVYRVDYAIERLGQ